MSIVLSSSSHRILPKHKYTNYTTTTTFKMHFSILVAALFSSLALSSPLEADKRQTCCTYLEIPAGVC
jgi:hypothetical protein